MFCPGCGTENAMDRGYCRKCGQRLSAVRSAIEGRPDEAVEKLSKGEKSLRGGLLTIGIFTFIAFFTALLSGPISLSIGDLKIEITHWSVSFIVGLIAGLPRVIGGLSRIRAAREILAGERAAVGIAETRPDLNKEIEDGRLISGPAASVTEHTTEKMELPRKVAQKE